MKKLLAYLLLLSLLIITVSACSKKDDPPASPTVNTYRAALLLRADAGSGNVTLDWLMESLAETYNIYWIEDAGNAYSITKPPSTATMQAGHKITGLISAPYTLTDLTNGTTYWFSISGVNSSGESQLEQPTYAIPTSPAPPPAPENVRANAKDANVIVTWDTVPVATSYNIHYEIISSDLTKWTPSTVIANVSSPFYASSKITTIENSSDAVTMIYIFWVTAVNGSGESSGSFAVRAEPSLDPPPMAPTDLTATPGPGSGQISLNWTAVTGVTYNVYGGTARGVTKSTSAIDTGGTVAGFTVIGLDKTKTYYFVVTAVGANTKESAESNEVSTRPHS